MPISEYDCAMARAAATSDVFNAIAEQQRREILVLLRAGEGPVTATERGAPAQSATADREIVISRVISAPRELVFEAFTEVRHLSRWWGPEGFTTTTRGFEFRVGGEWDFVMHGPDGTDYQE